MEAWNILRQEGAPNLAILDYIMPELTGPQVCKLVRERRGSYAYLLLLTAQGGQDDLIEGFDSGADDYLRKPFQELELRARLRVGERIIRAQRELIEMRNALQFQASHDPMTGLWNNGAIREMLQKELRRAERLSSTVSACLADLDHFKRVNETYGHLVGDEVLKETASRMSQVIREYDSVGRYGGEEFLAVLPDCSAASAGAIAERIRLSLCTRPVLTNAAEIAVSASIGVCEWRPGLDLSQVLSGADEALYLAKAAGRNQVIVHGGQLSEAEQVSSNRGPHAGSGEGR